MDENSLEVSDLNGEVGANLFLNQPRFLYDAVLHTPMYPRQSSVTKIRLEGKIRLVSICGVHLLMPKENRVDLQCLYDR